ncbi:tyrosine-type recombinase/integrase [Actinocatenispora comari]|uniref:Tyr recombinase domain-containing protein n=1 Tax=Actinocatenispora comari TaxID=2807577 RepID=A0A8J4ABJ0_9ACTN|nr:tyrosine-type recombinase/integrase [Actinocatenispora comari]GIL27364.1 hypothetical protein NUM_26180 [Actinocatenispora comari]
MGTANILPARPAASQVRCQPKPGQSHLRHAFATFLLTGGVELRTVMELLGHSTIRLTADTYGHVLPATARGASDVMDGLLRRGNG